VGTSKDLSQNETIMNFTGFILKHKSGEPIKYRLVSDLNNVFQFESLRSKDPIVYGLQRCLPPHVNKIKVSMYQLIHFKSLVLQEKVDRMRILSEKAQDHSLPTGNDTKSEKWFEDVTKKSQVELKNNDILAYIKRTELHATVTLVYKRILAASDAAFAANISNRNGYVVLHNSLSDYAADQQEEVFNDGNSSQMTPMGASKSLVTTNKVLSIDFKLSMGLTDEIALQNNYDQDTIKAYNYNLSDEMALKYRLTFKILHCKFNILDIFYNNKWASTKNIYSSETYKKVMLPKFHKNSNSNGETSSLLTNSNNQRKKNSNEFKFENASAFNVVKEDDTTSERSLKIQFRPTSSRVQSSIKSSRTKKSQNLTAGNNNDIDDGRVSIINSTYGSTIQESLINPSSYELDNERSPVDTLSYNVNLIMEKVENLSTDYSGPLIEYLVKAATRGLNINNIFFLKSIIKSLKMSPHLISEVKIQGNSTGPSGTDQFINIINLNNNSGIERDIKDPLLFEDLCEIFSYHLRVSLSVEGITAHHVITAVGNALLNVGMVEEFRLLVNETLEAEFILEHSVSNIQA